MQIELMAGIDRDRASKVVQDVASHLEIPGQAIDRVIIADSYGEAIASVLGQPGGRTHTETVDMQSAGKTVPKRGADGRVTSTIILPTFTIQGALAYLDPAHSGDRGVAEQLHYVIGHEFGHGKDYAARSTVQPSELNFNGSFRVAIFNRYWTQLLLEEFFACVHSGKAAPDQLVRRMAAEKMRGVEGFLDHVFGSLAAFWRKETDAQYVKVNVAVTYWRLLVEQAQLLGTGIGKGSELATVPSVWPQPNNKSKATDTKLATVLQELWQTYPNVDLLRAQETLGALWQEAIQVERDFRFEPGAQEDVLSVKDSLIG